MSVLIKANSKYQLTNFNREVLIEQFTNALRGRVESAYLFGSFATNTITPESDIDIVLIKSTTEVFPKRAFEFMDLFDIFPKIDILVYTEDEFQRLQDQQGFGSSIAKTLLKIL